MRVRRVCSGWIEKDIMEDRIMRRTLQMIEMGFLEEVNSLIQGGIDENPTARKL